MRRVPCETSHTHTLYTHIYAQADTHPHIHTLLHTHTHVCHEWPLAERQERVGAPDDSAIGRCCWVCFGRQ